MIVEEESNSTISTMKRKINDYLEVLIVDKKEEKSIVTIKKKIFE